MTSPNYRVAVTWAMEAGHHQLALELATNLRLYFGAVDVP